MVSSWTAYETVLSDLRFQRERIEVAIAAIEALRPAEEASGPQLPPTVKHQSAVAIQGRFGGMTIIDASLRVLEEADGPVHVGDITERIKDGGVPVSGDAPNTVGSILNRRMREKGDVKRIGRGTWALASYPLALDDSRSGRFEPTATGWDYVAPKPDDSDDDDESDGSNEPQMPIGIQRDTGWGRP